MFEKHLGSPEQWLCAPGLDNLNQFKKECTYCLITVAVTTAVVIAVTGAAGHRMTVQLTHL